MKMIKKRDSSMYILSNFVDEKNRHEEKEEKKTCKLQFLSHQVIVTYLFP